MNERMTIVIVSYDCRDALWECLRKLMVGHDVPSIIVVDNASSDDSLEIVSKEFPAVQLIKNTTNRGFAAAWNQAIRVSTSDFILLLAPDMLLNTTELQKLYEATRLHPVVGVSAPRILNPDRSLRPTCRTFPTFNAMIYEELGWSRLFPQSRRFARYRMGGWQHDETREVDQVGKPCFLVRRRALEHVGLFDERFFARFEDADLCWRLRQAGWQVLFVADSIATQTGSEAKKSDRAELIGYRYQGLFAFYRKHYPRWQLPVLRFVVQIAAFFRTITGKREYWPIVKNVWKL